MTLPELVEVLEARGVKLALRLVVDAPRGVMTEELKAALTAHKATLLARLGRESQWEHLAALRWGPVLREPEADDDGPDPYALAERQAIREEDRP